ncbi:MAG TPA: hypothetical protein VH141_27475 [Pseudonocardia sp.]|jgi:hypothetical protein|nr:hypothetical protein [Pseudonocardia sp.]
MANNATGSGDLTLEPSMIPKLRRAFQSALDQLEPLARGGADQFRMTRPAMADGASTEFQAAFNKIAADGPESAAQSLRAYRQRLAGVLKQLGDIQRAYDSNEHETAAELSRQLGS